MKRFLAVPVLLLAGCSGGGTPATAPSAPPSPPSTTASATTLHASPSAPASVPVPHAVPAGFRPVSASFVSDRAGWVLGESACSTPTPEPCRALARTVDSGKSWQAVGVPPASVDVVRFADQRTGFAFGRGLWRSEDAGRHWTALPGFDDVRALEVAQGRVWVVDGSEVYSSGIEGAPQRVRGLESVPQSDATQLAVHGDTVFTTTIAQGRSYLLWTRANAARTDRLRLPCADELQPYVTARTTQQLLLVCAAGEGAGGQEQKSAYLVDLRARQVRRVAPPAQLTGEHLGQTEDAWFVANHNGLEVSRDEGRHWLGAVEAPCGGLADVGFESRRLGFVLGDLDCTGGGMQITRDDGRTWTKADFHRTG